MTGGCNRAARGLLILLLVPLSGCLFTRRHLPVPRQPGVVQTATAEDLVRQINERAQAQSSFYATVEISASTFRQREGVEKDYTSFPGIIMVRKPRLLRVYGRVPVIGTRMFDMVSDGTTFTLYIPSKNMAYKGDEKHRAPAHPEGSGPDATGVDPALRHMRPRFFFDAMVLRGIEPDEYYSVIADTSTVEDPQKKHLYSVPEYVLSITRHNPGTHNDTPVRVVTFHREDLLPYQQDLYDDNGNLETQVFYSSYTDFDGNKYPSLVTIKRPLEGLQFVLRVDKVVENMALKDDQFEIQMPRDTRIEHLN